MPPLPNVGGITRGEWTEHEDQQLILGQRTLGNKWSRIAKEYLPGRPEDAVKNRWTSKVRDAAATTTSLK